MTLIEARNRIDNWARNDPGREFQKYTLKEIENIIKTQMQFENKEVNQYERKIISYLLRDRKFVKIALGHRMKPMWFHLNNFVNYLKD